MRLSLFQISIFRSYVAPQIGTLLAMTALATPLTAASADRQPGSSVAARLRDSRPIVVAHRGCWRLPAENSMPGFAACARLGVDFIETDLRETKDGVIVLLHDATLDRTTSLRGILRDLPYGAVRNARLRQGKGGPDAPLTDATLPTFEALLQAPLGNTFLFLDIKEPIHEDVFRLVRKYRAEDRVLFSMNDDFGPGLAASSFVGNAAVMPKLNQFSQGDCRHDADPAADLDRYAPLKARLYEVVFCDDDFLARAHALAGGAGIWVNALGPQFMGGRNEDDALTAPDRIWGDLLRRGVTALQTDHPEALTAYLRKIGRR